MTPPKFYMIDNYLLYSSVFVTVYDCSLIPNHTLTSSSENFVVSKGFFNNNTHIICTYVINIFIRNFIEKCVYPVLVTRVVFNPTVYLAACKQLMYTAEVTSYIGLLVIC